MVGVIVLIFILFNILPVNSARMTLGQRADTASVAAIEKVQVKLALVRNADALL